MRQLPPLNCGGCRKCCLGDTITLQQGDDPTHYETRRNPHTGALELRKGLDGNCTYLGEQGCKIHERAPSMCKAFDCRAYYLRYEHDLDGLGKRLQSQSRAALLEGRRRVKSLRARMGALEL